MKWVVDASAAAKWLAPEPDSPLAEALLDEELIVPDLLFAEVGNVLWKKQMGGEMDAATAQMGARWLLHAPLQVHDSADLLADALALALQLQHPAYDCFCLALAQQTDAPLVTADRRLHARCQALDALGLGGAGQVIGRRVTTMVRSLLALLTLAVGAYLVLCAALFFLQRSLIYFPQPRSTGNAASLLSLPTAAGKVLASTRLHEGPNALIYFGGNAEDVSYSLPGLSTAFPEHALYLLHYRGYGGSAGSPSETALVEDGLALFDTVRARHTHIAVVGRSLGSGVAVQVASRRPVARLVLVTPFDSLESLAASHYPIFPVRWLLRDTYRSSDFAPRVTAPTTIIAAERDEVVPRASAELLLTRFAEGIATIEVLPGMGHNTIEQSLRYWGALRELPGR